MLQRNNPFAKFIKKVTQSEHVQSNELVQQNQQQRNVFDFNNQGNIKAIFQNSIQQRDFQKQKPKKESKQQKKSAKNNNRQIMQQKKELNSNSQKTKVQVDFSSYPLCCRTYFFDQERILQAENRSLEYKSYRFPFTGPSTETFKKTICSFLNTIGGDIYIGIKETTVKKFRYVLGNYLTENDKEQVLKSFRKITESIYPNITQALQVQFIPIRKNPFPYTNLVGQLETYLYDFTKKPLNLKKCPYQGGRYVIRVRVPSGNKGVLYSYVQTEYQLNKNSTSNEFVAFRSQNEVLVKQMCQEVLKRFKQKLLYEKQQDHKIHDEPCIKPQIGDPRTQPEPEDQKIDAKQIQAVLYQNILRKRHPEERKENNDKKDSSDQEKAKLQLPTDANDVQVTEDELGAILKYPLTFVVKNMTEEKLKKCIDKTPAKNYTKIQTFKDVLIKVNRVLITIAGYHNMSNFLNIKSRIQDHFHKDCVEFIGVSKIMQFQSANNRKQMEKMLSINENHKFIINKNIIEFNSLVVGASYFMYMKALGYDMQVLRK